MRLFQALGYVCVRSAASKGLVDFVAIGPSDVVCCQVKATRWPSPAETEVLALLRVPANVRKVIYRYRDRVRVPDVRQL